MPLKTFRMLLMWHQAGEAGDETLQKLVGDVINRIMRLSEVERVEGVKRVEEIQGHRSR